MKLSISNIAWQNEEDEKIYSLMKKYGFSGLEIAPGRIWENPLDQTDNNINAIFNFFKKRKLEIIGMQGLLFGHPELKIFNNRTQDQTLAYLKKNIILASKLKTKALIFGSPKNRLIGNKNKEKAHNEAIKFFYQLGEFARSHNTCFCIEPNPKVYGTDFINTTSQAIDFVKKVNNPGLRLHLDLGAMIINKEDIDRIIKKAVKYAVYFHLGSPFLLPLDQEFEKYIRQALKTLVEIRYNGWVSIEMKSIGKGQNIKNVENALALISRLTGELL